MAREFSAGGVVVRRVRGRWMMAAIEPAGKGAQPATKPGGRGKKGVLALPKGLVDAGEKPEQTAIREVREETGVEATLVGKLGDVKYVYVRSWAGGERVFKVVSFYLLQYVSGTLGEIAEEMRKEVARAEWLPLEEASHLLTYKGERDMVARAVELLQTAALPGPAED